MDFRDVISSNPPVATQQLKEARFSFIQGGYVEDLDLQGGYVEDLNLQGASLFDLLFHILIDLFPYL